MANRNRPAALFAGTPPGKGVEPTAAVWSLLCAARQRFGAPGTADFARVAWSRPASRHHSGATSRAARHARSTRARHLALAGAYALACDDPSWLPALLDPSFARLRPLSAAVLSRVEHLQATHDAFSVARVRRLWRALAPHCLADSGSQRARHAEAALRQESAFAGLHVAGLCAGNALARDWDALWVEAEQRGALTRPHVRMRLAALGSRVSRHDAHVRWLMREDVRAFDLADALRFARIDSSPDITEETLASIGSVETELSHWQATIEGAPAANWVRLAGLVRAGMRARSCFDNPGHVLMVLTWNEALTRQAGTVARRLSKELSMIESVKQLEVARYRRALCALRGRPERERLKRLWRGPSRAATID